MNDSFPPCGEILLIGASGRLGRIVTKKLIDRGVKPRVLTRETEGVKKLFAAGEVDIHRGDLRDPPSLVSAFAGVERAFLLSPIAEDMVAQQSNAVLAAKAAGVPRVVKISGSDWTIGTSFSGDAHAAIEADLTANLPQWAAIRPNAWAQVGLFHALADLRSKGEIRANHDAAVSYIDIEDIADVAVHQLLAPEAANRPLVITGPRAVTFTEIGETVGSLLEQPVRLVSPPAREGVPSFEQQVIKDFMRVIAAGGASGVTYTVDQLLGRKPKPIEAILHAALASL